MSTLNAARVIGTGPRHVICLHGWFGSAANWGPFVPSLDTEAFTFAFLDYRGYGARQSDAGPFTMDRISTDVLALADELGWGRFALVGHSMGGMAIQRVLAEQPERVSAMVAITPVPASGVPFDDAGWGLFSSAAHDANARRTIIDFTTGSRLPAAWLDAMVAASFASSNAEAFGAYLDAWAKTSFVDRIEGKTLPVLVIAGEHDPALGQATCEATWLKHYPNARLQVMTNAGHYPMEETPVALAAAVNSFLRDSVAT